MNGIPQSYNGQPLVASWIYCAMDGASLGVVGRYQSGIEKEDVVPFFRRNGSSWAAGIDLEQRPLFGLNRLASHDRNKAVFVVESEKAAAALQSLGICAVTSLGGSQSITKTDWIPLSGYQRVYLLPDHDEPGNKYMQNVYAALSALEHPPVVEVLRLPDLHGGGDIVDWLQNHAPEWDGLEPFPVIDREWAVSELRALAKNAEPVPEEWSLAGLAGAGLVSFDWENPNEIETRTPTVQMLSPKLIPEPFRPWLADVSHRMQTPPDFPTVSALVIAGSIIGSGAV